MTKKLLDYLKSLTVSHVKFKHSETEGSKNIAYYEFDWVGLQSARNRNDVVLYVHKILGAWMNNKGDYEADKMNVIVIFYHKVGMNNLRNTRNILLTCKDYAEQFRKKMEHDRSTSEDLEICELLRLIDTGDWLYEQTELSNDGWIGLQVKIPLKTEMSTTYDESLWL